MKDAAASSAQAGILPHHQVAAGVWSLGGENYDEISFGVSDALAHAAQRLAPQADEQILDVATGTGWSARNVARAGARVTAVDIAADLLTAPANCPRMYARPSRFSSPTPKACRSRTAPSMA
jgi:SAM-dependent methyltransferase